MIPSVFTVGRGSLLMSTSDALSLIGTFSRTWDELDNHLRACIPALLHSLLPSDLVAQSVERRRSNPKVVGSIPTLVRVFLCPCVGPFPSVGLTLTWFIWDRNLALHITLYSVNSAWNNSLEIYFLKRLYGKSSHPL